MSEQDVVNQKMLGKVGELFRLAVEQVVTTRIKKYKASNDSLRKELSVAKQAIEGLESEREPLLKSAREAGEALDERRGRVERLKVTVQALQTQNTELTARIKAAVVRKRR